MQLDSFRHDDMVSFLLLAAEEGWICERDEFLFLMECYPQGCFAVRGPGGKPLGFITSIAYRKSGWIGNLIVAREQRRAGIGTLLMQTCLDTLESSGVGTVWLTASASGAPLYERMGFREIDRIVRWRLDRSLCCGTPGVSAEEGIQDLFRRDRLCWGDDRTLLCLDALRHGRLLSGAGASMVIRDISSGSFIGPWEADSPQSASELLESLMGSGSAEGATFVDLPEMNGQAAALLQKNGFTRCSETVLMYLGEVPDYRVDMIFALASPGSIG